MSAKTTNVMGRLRGFPHLVIIRVRCAPWARLVLLQEAETEQLMSDKKFLIYGHDSKKRETISECSLFSEPRERPLSTCLETNGGGSWKWTIVA